MSETVPEPVTISVDLEPDRALALAQFAKRLTFAEARACAVDEDEAYRMIYAIEAVQDALAAAGYAPR